MYYIPVIKQINFVYRLLLRQKTFVTYQNVTYYRPHIRRKNKKRLYHNRGKYNLLTK